MIDRHERKWYFQLELFILIYLRNNTITNLVALTLHNVLGHVDNYIK